MGTPVLYILMPNDLASLNSGKAMAQASHASNAFAAHVNLSIEDYNSKQDASELEISICNGFAYWENSTSQSFGTVLVLAAKMPDIKSTVDIFNGMGYIAGVVHDPTYPIVDGEVVHHIPLDTCAYVFVPSKETDFTASALLKRFSLHP